jgi:uncharacterized protein DUF6174
MKKLIFKIVIFTMLLSACSPAQKSELKRHQEKWQNQNISHYRFQLSVGCFCAFSQQMPLTVEVNSGEVVSIVNNTGEPVSADLLDIFNKYNTIDRLFEFVQTAQGEADEIKVTYDDKYGFPIQVSIDYIKNAMDDELGLTVSSFEVLK